jgi:hypothetical protein
MAEAIDKIPEKMRWEIATKGLTGAYTAVANALKDAVGENKYNEFNGPLWYEAGKGAKELADSLGLKTETPKDIATVFVLATVASMGPEMTWEIVESSEDKCVAKQVKCPWHERSKELSLSFDFCGSGHQKWCEGACESLNPNFTATLTKNMVRGDAYCETIIERKK